MLLVDKSWRKGREEIILLAIAAIYAPLTSRIITKTQSPRVTISSRNVCYDKIRRSWCGLYRASWYVYPHSYSTMEHHESNCHAISKKPFTISHIPHRSLAHSLPLQIFLIFKPLLAGSSFYLPSFLSKLLIGNIEISSIASCMVTFVSGNTKSARIN